MEALRQIPPINDVLESPRLASFRALLQTPFGARILNDVFGETRRQLTAEGVVIGYAAALFAFPVVLFALYAIGLRRV